MSYFIYPHLVWLKWTPPSHPITLSIFTHYQPAPNSKTLPIPVFRNFALSFTVFVAINNTSAFPLKPPKQMNIFREHFTTKKRKLITVSNPKSYASFLPVTFLIISCTFCLDSCTDFPYFTDQTTRYFQLHFYLDY